MRHEFRFRIIPELSLTDSGLEKKSSPKFMGFAYEKTGGFEKNEVFLISGIYTLSYEKAVTISGLYCSLSTGFRVSTSN